MTYKQHLVPLLYASILSLARVLELALRSSKCHFHLFDQICYTFTEHLQPVCT